MGINSLNKKQKLLTINNKLPTNKHLFALLNSFKFAFIKTQLKDNEQYNHNHKF